MAEVTLRELPCCTRISLQGGLRALAALGEAYGAEPSTEPLTASIVHAGPRAALWLGPDEWLLLAEEGAAADLLAALGAALGTEPASLVDVSDRYHGLDLQGPAAPVLLREGCPLDLDDGAFPPGRCARTVFAKAEIVLWRTAADRWRIEVARSFASYLLALMREAAADLPD
jgi:sarcosine oxidase subunit gamma